MTVAPLKLTVPCPLIAPLSANVRLENCSVAPLFTVQDPAHVLPHVPPPPKLSVPALAATVPVLLNAIGLFTVLVAAVVLVPVFSNVPLLLNAVPVPPPFTIDVSF